MNSRQKEILKIVNTNGNVNLHDLITTFEMSEQTIRNDLRFLDKNGYVKRTHGGAESIEIVEVNPYSKRIQKNFNLKDKVGKLASTLIDSNDTIFLDAGTSILALIEHLPEEISITVVTNALHTAQRLASFPNIQIHLVGGLLNKNLFEAGGPKTLSELSKIKFQKSFISISEFSSEIGISEDHPISSDTKSLIIKNSKETIVLADSTKQNEFTLTNFAPWDQIDVFVIDNAISDNLVKSLLKHNVKVMTA